VSQYEDQADKFTNLAFDILFIAPIIEIAEESTNSTANETAGNATEASSSSSSSSSNSTVTNVTESYEDDPNDPCVANFDPDTCEVQTVFVPNFDESSTEFKYRAKPVISGVT
jgi:hypothetical protein